MQIVIDISEDTYKYFYNGGSIGTSLMIENAIKNGIPLPKGHGDLKDMGNLKYMFDLTREDFIYSGKEIERTVKSMTTIIPADTESEDEE